MQMLGITSAYLEHFQVPTCTGKTTLLRDVTRQLADVFHKLVMVVDPSEEIAGGGDLPHACIGTARRMLGTVHQSKYEVLEEAVANHGPEVRVCCYIHGYGAGVLLTCCI